MVDSYSQEVATYYANIVTANIFQDEVVLEFRRFLRSHKENFEKFGEKPIPAPDAAEIFKDTPVVRLVLTFTAAKALVGYLQKTLPIVEAQRKA